MSHLFPQTGGTIRAHSSRSLTGGSLLDRVLDLLVPSRTEAPLGVLPEVSSASDFRNLLRRASARAETSNRGFSVVAFDAGNASDRMALHHVLADRLRLTDEIGCFGDSWIGVFLYEAPSRDAWRFAQSVRTVLGELGVPVRCNVYSYPVDRQRIRDASRQACEQAGKPLTEVEREPIPVVPEPLDGLVLEGELA